MSNLEQSILPKNESDKLKAIDISLVISSLFNHNDSGYTCFGDVPLTFNFDKVPEKYLNQIAKMFNVELWQDDWLEDRKRQFLREFRNLKKHSGTKTTVRKVISLFLLTENIDEYLIVKDIEDWFDNPDLSPGVMIIRLNESLNLNETQVRLLHKLIDIYKAAHTHFTLGIVKGINANLCYPAIINRNTFKKTLCNINPVNDLHLNMGLIFTIVARRFIKV